MIKRGRHIIRNHMVLEYEFTGIRIQEAFFTPVDWKLEISLIAPDQKGKSKKDIEHKASIAYQKLYFWLDANLPNIVVVDVEDEDDLYLANLSSNIMMYCPGSVSDDVMIRLLHSKLSVLAAPEIVVAEIKLRASDTSLQYNFDCEDGDYKLPATTEDYYTGGTARDVEPWWTRNDGFCFEFIRPVDDQGKEIEGDEVFADIVDPMDEFHRLVAEVDNHINLMKEPARIVQVERWKPKKLEE
jgi:hypothetical protein